MLCIMRQDKHYPTFNTSMPSFIFCSTGATTSLHMYVIQCQRYFELLNASVKYVTYPLNAHRMINANTLILSNSNWSFGSKLLSKPLFYNTRSISILV